MTMSCQSTRAKWQEGIIQEPPRSNTEQDLEQRGEFDSTGMRKRTKNGAAEISTAAPRA
jgi:hypothetical protein